MRQGLRQVSLSGRYQRVAGSPTIVLDVAHNPDATHELATLLQEDAVEGKTVAVVGMMSDKALADSLRPLLTTVDIWHVADLPPPRGTRADDLSRILKRLEPASTVESHEDIQSAFTSAQSAAAAADRIVVFGSFVGVGVIMHQLS
jgi:dihydrofolate synthase/folylpolyglutamate synthase